MQEIKYADAGMDMKRILLCFMRRLWIVPLAAAIGALAGFLIYEAARVVPESEREYRAVAKVYLDFAPDETGEVYQAYNGYTWNDLMTTDPILDVTMRYLPQDYTKEEVAAATKAEILSDLRLLTITVTAHDRERCGAILEATGRSLAERGETAKEFRKIEVIRNTEPALVVADSRTLQAVLVGIVAAAALALLGMMFYYVLDDRILVANDLKQVTDVPFVGYAGAGERWNGAYEDDLAYLAGQIGKLSVLTVRQSEMIPQEKWRELCEADGVVVAVEGGRVHAAFLGYMIGELSLRGCRLAGIAISGADESFLRRYYGRAIGGKNRG